MKRYELAVTSPEYWSEIHDALIVDSNQDGIPDRQVTCTDSKNHSPTRGTYELTEEEAAEIAAHPHVKWIELSPIDNPDSYPEPQFATKRFKKNVKFYRDIFSSGIPATNPTSVELDRSNYGVARPTVRETGTFFSDNSGTVAVEEGDVSYSLTGKNVDVIIHDSGVLQYHPEFMDANGQSRVRDIILDGPYHIDPDYFISNGYTTTRADGRVTGQESASRDWWTNSSNRSAQFQSEGTITVSTNYTEARSMGGSLDGTNSLTSGHGTACASLVAGKNFGNAFEANIWNMPGIGDNVSMGVETNYDAMKIWQRLKPVNSETGRKNPTIINGSWGYQAAFSSGDTVIYKFRGSTGSFTGNAAVTDQITAMKDGLNNQVTGAYRSWSSSSRSNSTDAAADELMLEGVIYVAAAGNNNQRLGIGADDPDRLNYLEDDWFSTTDPRDEFPSFTVPCNHRDWMNPQGIGFDESKDFHPVVCVGALEDTLTTAGAEYQASYSNNGPGIDVWAPADETLAAGTNGVSGYIDYERYDDNRFYDASFNGTSAAAPVACGLIALFLEANPTADSRAVHNWLKDHGTTLLETTSSTSSGDGFLDQYSDDTQTSYWTGDYNLRGAEPRVTYNPYANDDIPSVEGVTLEGITLSYE
jgi:hypothetical protein